MVLVLLTGLSVIVSCILFLCVIALNGIKGSTTLTNQLFRLVNVPHIKLLMLIAVFVFRYISNIPKTLFFLFMAANMSIITAFYVTRINIIISIATAATKEEIGYIPFLILFIFSIGFSLLRLFLKMGLLLERHFINNPKIFFFWEDVSKPVVNILTFIGKRVANAIPPTSGSLGADRNFYIGLSTFIATSVAGCGSLYLGAQVLIAAKKAAVAGTIVANAAVENNKIAARQLDFNERQLDFDERQTDMDEVIAKRMPEHIYIQKWDEYGRRRK